MQKKKYPYQVVLDARAEKKRQAELFVKSCREQLEQAEEELACRVRAVEGCARVCAAAQQALDELSRSPAKARLVVEHLEYIAELQQQQGEAEARAVEQREVVARAAGTVEQALSALTEAARDEKAVENHREDWRHERRREEARAEQKRLDEAGSILHGRRQQA